MRISGWWSGFVLVMALAFAGCSCDEDAGGTDGGDGDADGGPDSGTDSGTDSGAVDEEEIGRQMDDAVTDVSTSGSGEGFVGLLDGMVDALATAEDDTVDFATCPSVDTIGEDGTKLSYGSVSCLCDDPNDPDLPVGHAAPCPTRSGILAAGPIFLERGRPRDEFDWQVTFGGEEITDCNCVQNDQLVVLEDVPVELPHRRGRAIGAPRYVGGFLVDRGGQGEWTVRDSTVQVDVRNQSYPIVLSPNVTIQLGGDGTATVGGGAELGETYTIAIDPSDPLVFDRNDDCECPTDGTLTIHSVEANRDLIVIYQNEQQQHCGADVVKLRSAEGLCSGEDPPAECDVNLAAEQAPSWLPSDLAGIDGLCLNGRYSCPRSENENECINEMGTYHVLPGGIRYTLEDEAGPLSEPLTADEIAGLQPGMPERLCHEAVLGQLDALRSHAWRFEIHANCQVDIAEGRPDRIGDELRWQPRTACARYNRESGTLGNADLGGNVGDLFFGTMPGGHAALTIGGGTLTLDAVFPVDGRIADTCRSEIDDANACLHSWTIPSGCALRLADLLDPATPPDDFLTEDCQNAKTRINQCTPGALRALAERIAAYDDSDDGQDLGCIVIGGDGRLGFEGRNGCDGERVLTHLASLLADVRSDDDENPFVSMLEFLPVIDTDGLRQRVILEADRMSCDADQCLPDLGGDEAYARDSGELPGHDSHVSISLGTGQRVHHVTIGQITLDVPDMGDLEETCRRVETVCGPAEEGGLLGTYGGIADFTGTCDAMDRLCDALGAEQILGLLDEWLAGTDPADWGTDGPTGLTLDQIRAALDEWSGTGDGYGDRTASFAHVFVVDVDDDLGGTTATIDDDVDLVPEPDLVLGTLEEITKRELYEAFPFYQGGDLWDGAVLLGASSITEGDGHFEYDGDRATYSVRIVAPARPDVVLDVPVAEPIEVCHPTGWMLDNFYSPAIYWNGTHDGFVDALPAEDFPSVRDLDTLKAAIAAAIGEDAPQFVTMHLGSYEPGEEGFPGNPSYNPLNQHLGLWRVLPDVGLFTMLQPTWAEVAPTGRNYMNTPQPLLDYVLNIAMIRAERRLFTAEDLYGDGYDEVAWRDDIALVKTVSIDFKVNFVFNTDLIADENSYFFRRDVLGAMIDMCEL